MPPSRLYAPAPVVLGALLIGGIVGSLLDIEFRLEAFGGWMRTRLSRGKGPAGDAEPEARVRFIEGFVPASLVFCVGPLTILGSLSDGLGLGAERLILKAVLDGFASIAFAASLGVGVMASAVAVAFIQGTLTLVSNLLPALLAAPLLVQLVIASARLPP